MFYLMSFTFNLGQPFHVLLLASVAANVALLLPSSPGGVGNFEYFCAQTISFFGVEMALARSYAIVVHMTLLIPIVLLGFYFLWRENISLAEASSYGQSIFDYKPNSNGAKDYMELCQEILKQDTGNTLEVHDFVESK